jgi:amidase
VRRCAGYLRSAGCEVKEDLPKDLMMEMEDVRFRLTNADGWTFVQRMAAKWGTKAVSPVLTDRMRREPVSAAEFIELLERQDESRTKLLQWFKSYDVILCPAAGRPAEPINLGDEVSRRNNPGRSYTGLYNSTGWPAAVVRGGTSPEGLPIGIQVVGRPWREDVVLAVSRHLEEKTGGWQKPSP